MRFVALAVGLLIGASAGTAFAQPKATDARPLSEPLATTGIAFAGTGALSAVMGMTLIGGGTSVCTREADGGCEVEAHQKVGIGMILGGGAALVIGVPMIVIGSRPVRRQAATAVPVVRIGSRAACLLVGKGADPQGRGRPRPRTGARGSGNPAHQR